MKKLAIVGAAVAVLLGATGCGTAVDDSGYSNGYLNVRVVQLPDDSTVDCVYFSGGISCDWATRG